MLDSHSTEFLIEQAVGETNEKDLHSLFFFNVLDWVCCKDILVLGTKLGFTVRGSS